MLWLIDTLQNKVSADQYHMIIYLKFRALQGDVFVEEDRLPSAGFFPDHCPISGSFVVSRTWLLGDRLTLTQD